MILSRTITKKREVMRLSKFRSLNPQFEEIMDNTSDRFLRPGIVLQTMCQ
jgi:hypothetical protein